jgi:hypothetical protein
VSVALRLTLGVVLLAIALYGVAVAPIGIYSMTWLMLLVAGALLAGDAAGDLLGEP